MWPFNNASLPETLPTFVNQLMATATKDLEIALNVATAQADKIGMNCYQTLLDEQAKLLGQLGLKPGDTVGIFAINEILHALNTNQEMQKDILATIQLACAPMVQRTITDAQGITQFLTSAAALVTLAAPIAG